MRVVKLLLLFALFALVAADHDDDDGPSRAWPYRRWPASRPRSQPWPRPQPRTNPYGRCGGHRQACCGGRCASGLRCLHDGDQFWKSEKKRCMRVKQRGKCGVEGMKCCGGKCISGMKCGGGWMCRKPQDEIRTRPGTSPVQDQTVAQLSGWIKVIVIARGGKCYSRVKGSINTSVETFGDGTFGETFGDLSAMGECAEGAQGVGIGYIRAEVLATATRGADGECITDNNTEIEAGSKVQGEGITVGVGGTAGAEVGCNRRKMLRDLLN